MFNKLKKYGWFFILIPGVLSWFGFRPDHLITPPTNGRFCSGAHQSFLPGEVIVYKIYYNWNFVWIPAGEVTFKVSDQGDFYKLSAVGRTYASYEWFFKVRDYFEAIVDKGTLLPTSSIRDIHEGKYTRYNKTEFNQSKPMIKYTWGKTKHDLQKSGVFTPVDCTHDVLSIIYALRNADFETWKQQTNKSLGIFLDNDYWPVNITNMGKEVKKIHNLGKYPTIHLSPETIAGSVFKEGDRMHVWSSDDANRIPLLIESPVSVGSIKVVIHKWSGLKHPSVLTKTGPE